MLWSTLPSVHSSDFLRRRPGTLKASTVASRRTSHPSVLSAICHEAVLPDRWDGAGTNSTAEFGKRERPPALRYLNNDHRLPLPFRKRRRTHRTLGHGSAVGEIFATGSKAGITHTNLFAAFRFGYAIANREVARIVVSRPGRFLGFAFLHPAHEVPLGGRST